MNLVEVWGLLQEPDTWYGQTIVNWQSEPLVRGGTDLGESKI